jgi:PDZ domain-containing protein
MAAFPGAGPEPESGAGEAEPPVFPRWGWWALGMTFVLMSIAVAGFLIHVPYSTISPGAAVELPPLIQVKGRVATYTGDRGDIRLLFVRERNRINLWRYVQAKLDKDIDLFKVQQLNPDNRSQTQLNEEAAQQMADAKTAATKVALQYAGYKVLLDDGVTVSDVAEDLPAGKVLQPGDVILRADGKTIVHPTDLTSAIAKHKVGDKISLDILRDGKPKTVLVPIGTSGNRKVIGVLVSPRYKFPFTVNVDTEGIGGPSAGLAMTLAIFDELTPGNLTGGQRVAVTGTIDSLGNVGEIGGINQKAVAARAAGARLFIVPACQKALDAPPDFAACQKDLQRAKERAGSHVKVVAVSTFVQALQALRDAGGPPVATSTTAPAAA